MEFLDWVLVAVIGGVAVAAIVGARTWLWRRRRRPIDWAAAGRDAFEARRRGIERAHRDLLVEFVLERAKILNIQVPAAVHSGAGYVTVTYHPSGNEISYVAAHTHYKALLESGQLPPQRTYRKRWTQPPVAQWSEDELRAWLHEHANVLPHDRPAS